MTEKSKEERWDMVERRREKFGTRERLLWKSCEKECESDLAEKLDFRSQRNSVGTGDLGSIDLSLPSREMALPRVCVNGSYCICPEVSVSDFLFLRHFLPHLHCL